MTFGDGRQFGRAAGVPTPQFPGRFIPDYDRSASVIASGAPVAYTMRISLGLAGLSGVTSESSTCTMTGSTAVAVRVRLPVGSRSVGLPIQLGKWC